MAFEEVLNFSGVILSPETIAKVDGLITVLKAAGVIFIIYVAYLVVRMVLGWKSTRRIKKIEKKVNAIDKKLDRALRKKKKD